MTQLTHKIMEQLIVSGSSAPMTIGELASSVSGAYRSARQMYDASRPYIDAVGRYFERSGDDESGFDPDEVSRSRYLRRDPPSTVRENQDMRPWFDQVPSVDDTGVIDEVRIPYSGYDTRARVPYRDW